MNNSVNKPDNQNNQSAPAAKVEAPSVATTSSANVQTLKVSATPNVSNAVRENAPSQSVGMPKPSAPNGTPAKSAPALNVTKPVVSNEAAKKPVVNKPVENKIAEKVVAKPAVAPKVSAAVVVKETANPNNQVVAKKLTVDAKIEKADKSNMINASIGVPGLPMGAMFGNFYDNQMQVMKMIKNSFTNTDEMTAIGQANVDAIMKSSQIVAKGMEELSKAMFNFAQSSVQQTVEMTKACANVKTMSDLTELQKQSAKKSFDSVIAEGTKMSEMSVKVANDAMEPINARVKAVMSKMSKSA
jgi:phasin family protein